MTNTSPHTRSALDRRTWWATQWACILAFPSCPASLDISWQSDLSLKCFILGGINSSISTLSPPFLDSHPCNNMFLLELAAASNSAIAFHSLIFCRRKRQLFWGDQAHGQPQGSLVGFFSNHSLFYNLFHWKGDFLYLIARAFNCINLLKRPKFYLRGLWAVSGFRTEKTFSEKNLCCGLLSPHQHFYRNNSITCIDSSQFHKSISSVC